MGTGQVIDGQLASAYASLRCGLRGTAENFLGGARYQLDRAFTARGIEWDERRKRRDELSELLRRPCDCWYCGLSSDHKAEVKERTRLKKSHLDGVPHSNSKNNYTGAYGEVVFGARFNLPVNMRPGGDGEVDFFIEGPGTPPLMIDVKATTLVDTNGLCDFPSQKDWLKEIVYVLLQVAEYEHVYFRGFALGTDPYDAHRLPNGRPVYGPSPSRTLKELERLIRST